MFCLLDWLGFLPSLPGHFTKDARCLLLLKQTNKKKTWLEHVGPSPCPHSSSQKALPISPEYLRQLHGLSWSTSRFYCCFLVTKFCSTPLQPQRLSWGFSGKSTGMDCHFLLQGSSWPRNPTHVSCIAGGFLTTDPQNRGSCVIISSGKIEGKGEGGRRGCDG